MRSFVILFFSILFVQGQTFAVDPCDSYKNCLQVFKSNQTIEPKSAELLGDWYTTCYDEDNRSGGGYSGGVLVVRKSTNKNSIVMGIPTDAYFHRAPIKQSEKQTKKKISKYVKSQLQPSLPKNQVKFSGQSAKVEYLVALPLGAGIGQMQLEAKKLDETLIFTYSVEQSSSQRYFNRQNWVCFTDGKI